MAQPAPYNRITSFQTIQQEFPTDPLPGDELDAELNAVKTTLDQILDNIARIQRDDGEVANNTIGLDQLRSELSLGFSPPAPWQPGIAYDTFDSVFYGGAFYRGQVKHTSSDFGIDLAAGKWSLIADLSKLALFFQTTSVTPQTISLGTKTFTVESGKFFAVNDYAQVSFDDSNYMLGRVTAYSGTNLTVNVVGAVGAGTYSAWTIKYGGSSAVGSLFDASVRTDIVQALTGAQQAQAQTNIGLVPGTTVQAQSAELSAIVAQNTSGVLQRVGAGSWAILNFDNDNTLAANSSIRVPTQAAVKAYVDALIGAADAMVFKGVIDCSANPNYPAADRGHSYKVSVAGKIGGASGTNVEIGDLLICATDATASGTQAAVGANWTIVQNNLDGAVIGPASAVSGNVVSFNGTTGKLIQDSGKALPAGAIVGTTDTQTLSGKTISGASNTLTNIGGTSIRMGADAQGDILYFNGTNYVRLPAGTTGNFLKTLGAGANPAWSAVPGGGDVLAANNGTEFRPATFATNLGLIRTVKKQVFTTSQTYTPSVGMLFCIIEAVAGGGAGGGSGGSTSLTFSGAGGGSGGYSRTYATAAAIGASKAVTIGTGGTGVVNGTGSNGGDTSVGTLCIAKGGSGGTQSNSGAGPNPGVGGVIGTGDVVAAGSPGGGGIYNGTNGNIYSSSGQGGSSYFGGGAAGNTPAGALSAAGNSGGNYGAGGSGAYSHQTTSSGAGGPGANGVVIITEFCTQ